MVGNNWDTDRDPAKIRQVINRYMIPPHKRVFLDGELVYPDWKPPQKRLHKRERLILVHYYIGAYQTHNASRIARLIFDDYEISVKRQTIATDIKQIQKTNPLMYEVVDSSLVRGVLDRKEKYYTMMERLNGEIKKLTNFHSIYMDFKRLMQKDESPIE